MDDTKCPECGKMHRGNTYCLNSLTPDLNLGYCFECAFWREKVREQKEGTEPNRCIVDGHVYYPYPGTDHSGYLGFGGAVFHFRKNSGEEILSNNVWHEGDVPAHFRPQLPDNAVLVKDHPLGWRAG
jgi:hypothetical protein